MLIDKADDMKSFIRSIVRDTSSVNPVIRQIFTYNQGTRICNIKESNKFLLKDFQRIYRIDLSRTSLMGYTVYSL